MANNIVAIPSTCGNGMRPLPEGIDERRLVIACWQYLHGRIQDMAERQGGWDLFDWLDAEPSVGIHKCKVVMPNRTYNCVAYIWQVNPQKNRGLVVMRNDKAANEYALKAFNNKQPYL